MRFVLFTLAAPLASFGTIAVGERRPTWDRPSKSQILGLVAGALGIERSDEARQQRLADGLGFAVRVDDVGTLLADYHTAQAASQASIRRSTRSGRPIRTRADELACGDLKTILSRREYRMGSLHTLCLWRQAPGEPTVEAIAGALPRPAFAPFAGRKANALMLPMRPAVIEAAHLETALVLYDGLESEEMRAFRWEVGIAPGKGQQIFADRGAPTMLREARIEQRRDMPQSRAKWRFELRAEVLLEPRRPGGGR